MKKTSIIKRVLVFVALISIIPAMAVSANPRKGMRDGHHPRSFKSHSVFKVLNNPQLAQELNLTDAQKEKISDYNFAFKEKKIKFKSEIDQLQLQMKKAFSDDPKNSKKIISLAKKISDVRGQLFVERVESQLAALKVLNDDQLSKLPQQRFKKPRR